VELVEPCRAKDVGDGDRRSAAAASTAGVCLSLCLSKEPSGIEVEKEDKEDDKEKGNDGCKHDVTVV